MDFEEKAEFCLLHVTFFAQTCLNVNYEIIDFSTVFDNTSKDYQTHWVSI